MKAFLNPGEHGPQNVNCFFSFEKRVEPDSSRQGQAQEFFYGLLKHFFDNVLHEHVGLICKTLLTVLDPKLDFPFLDLTHRDLGKD